MPLIKIETRAKDSPDVDARAGARADDAPAPVPAAEKPVSSARRAREARQARQAAAPAADPMKAMVGGAVFGLIVVAGIGAFLFARQSNVPSGALAGPVTAPGNPLGATDGGVTAPVAPGGPATAVPPLNSDYARSTIIATVGSEPYRMADLESAVRVAHTLASLAGEQLTPYNDPGIRDLQIQMLKRQVDMLLMKQAVLRENIPVPGDDIKPQIDAYLERIGSSREKLNAAMAANGVTEAEVDKWFKDSRTTTAYVVEKLLKGKDLSQREAVTKAWLADEWRARESDILINFYEPSPSLASGTPPAASAPATGNPPSTGATP